MDQATIIQWITYISVMFLLQRERVATTNPGSRGARKKNRLIQATTKVMNNRLPRRLLVEIRRMEYSRSSPSRWRNACSAEEDSPSRRRGQAGQESDFQAQAIKARLVRQRTKQLARTRDSPRKCGFTVPGVEKGTRNTRWFPTNQSLAITIQQAEGEKLSPASSSVGRRRRSRAAAGVMRRSGNFELTGRAKKKKR